MIKIIIDKAQVKSDADQAAFAIVKSGLEKTVKKVEADVKKEGGSVAVRVVGPGAFEVSMEGISPRLRKKISSLVKTQSRPVK